MTLKSMLEKRGGGQPLLKGSDAPEGTKHFFVVVKAIREAPDDFGACAIMDFAKPVFDKLAWAVNKTNMKTLIKLFGEDERRLIGKKLRLEVISVRNPSTGIVVPSLLVSPKQ